MNEKWEYMIVDTQEEDENENYEKILDRYGDSGWILCAVESTKDIYDEDCSIFYFRRQKN